MLSSCKAADYGSDKVLDFDKAVLLIGELKKKGKKIGLCHGGFDLLHPGHAKHFESAKKLCDVLFASITSDRFVECRKGGGRPIFPDKLRAYMAASLEYVDYAVVSDFKKGIEVIRLLKPSFYIKGPDFIKKNTPGINAERDAIVEVGGQMRYTEDIKLSTTDIISYIKNNLHSKDILLVIDRDGTIIRNDDFFGKENDWKGKMEFREDIISLISYLQTKYSTVKIVVTNQSGVARGLFSCQRVEEINKAVGQELESRGIKIDVWKYCPDADSEYAKKHPEIRFTEKYVKEKTKRKPSPSMVLDSLESISRKIGDFDEIIVIGDREEDAKLAANLNARFADAGKKSYDELVKEF